jgi:phage baseplate assembly protein W
MRQINYPFRIDSRRRVADTPYDLHIRQMIEQVLFTIPGERVNRPEFGCGLQQLIFALNSDELATATQFLVKGSLERWLGELIEIEEVEVENDEARLLVTIQYVVRRNQQRQVAEFSREV